MGSPRFFFTAGLDPARLLAREHILIRVAIARYCSINEALGEVGR
jgi:hypothetical protein